MSQEKVHTVFALPRSVSLSGLRRSQQRWIARGDLSQHGGPLPILGRMLRATGATVPVDGLGALRLLGQTGETAGGWVAALDLVFLEAGMNRLRLHALSAREIPDDQVRSLFESVDELLTDEQQFRLTICGRSGYLQGGTPMATASVSPETIDGQPPDEFLPGGKAAASHSRMMSEIQMHLHDHVINEQRRMAGLRPANSGWIWGGGRLPAAHAGPLPALYADDLLMRGYWSNAGAPRYPWRDLIVKPHELAREAVVAVMPDTAAEPGMVAGILEDLRAMLGRSRTRRLTLLFADGLTAVLSRRDRLRIWRGWRQPRGETRS